ncbi:MAG: preprotein translocase subunit YajC [Gammaproteobacteria bacterium]|nr:preprotein translocase subunit YajC [Gammaproteobacteria bacterium]
MNLTDVPVYMAAAAPAAQEPAWMPFVMMGGILVLFYFMLIRPQNKRRKEHQNLLAGLQKGDEVVTAGGMVGVINKVEDDFVKVQVAPNIEIRVQKSAVGATLPKGTVKTLDAA